MMNEEIIRHLENLNKDADCTPEDVEHLIDDWRTLSAKVNDQSLEICDLINDHEILRKEFNEQEELLNVAKNAFKEISEINISSYEPDCLSDYIHIILKLVKEALTKLGVKL